MQLYTTQQVADRSGVHKLTLLRWMREGRIREPVRDRRGWRVFSEAEAQAVVAFARGHEPSLDVPETNAATERLVTLDWDFHGAKTSYLTHGLHPYPAKFIPQIPNTLIQELSSVGDTVADIFCGSGTTLLEALQLKRHAIGIDANPLAALISEAKTGILSEAELEELSSHRADCEALGRELRSMAGGLFEPGATFRSNGWRPREDVCEFWFDPHVVEELAEIRRRLSGLSPRAGRLAKVAFSAIIVAVSKQDSDTRYVRREKGIKPGDAVVRYVSSLANAISSAREAADILEERFTRRVINSNILDAPDVDRIDLMVTSPPYPNAFSYHLYHRTRMLWLGHDPEKFKKEEIGSHRKYSAKGLRKIDESTFAEEFSIILRWLADRMDSGKYACFVIGDSTIAGRKIDNATLISEVGARAGFVEAARIERTIQATKKAFNPAIGKIRQEHILVMKRSS